MELTNEPCPACHTGRMRPRMDPQERRYNGFECEACGGSWTRVNWHSLMARRATAAGKQLVVCSAIRNLKTEAVIASPRHYDGVTHATIALCGDKEGWKSAEQGFVDQFGVFLTREAAHAIAWARGQIRRRCGGDAKTLYSENLY